jgi:phage protein U
MAPRMMVTGYGLILGWFVCTEITEEQGGILDNGMPRKQAFTAEFRW